MSLSELSASQKEELVVSLAALICHDAEVESSADNLNAIISASGNSVAPYWATLFSSMIEKTGGVEKFLASPSAGGGGGGAAAAGGAGGDAGAEEAPKKEEEESAEEMGGMDMFGDEGGY